MSTQPGTPQQAERKAGFFLRYQDYKKLERIIEDYNYDSEKGIVDFSRMQDDEKDILWKIKTIIRNMESVRLRPNNENKENE